MTIAEVIKKRRAELGFTLLDIAKRMDVSEATVQRWESGNIKSLRYERVTKLAEILKVSPAYLMGWEDNAVPSNLIPISALKTKIVPLLGDIACGEPILAEENIADYINMPEELHGNFCLRCKGDSMIESRIFDGDLVFIRQQPEVENGEIAAVLIDGEATLKKFYKYKNRIELRAANPTFPPLEYVDEEMATVRILGKAVTFVSMVR